MGRINGQSFDIRIGGFMAHVESFSLSIEDATTAAKTKGRPDGVLHGEVSASGEIVVDIANFALISAAAKKAGSWRELETFDINAYASGSNGGSTELMHVLAHECKIKISEVLNIDPSSTDKSKVTLPYDVTGKDFVWINGTPYLPGSDLDLI